MRRILHKSAFALVLAGLASGTHASELSFEGSLARDVFPDVRAGVGDGGWRGHVGVTGFVDLASVRLAFDLDAYRANYLQDASLDGAVSFSGGDRLSWQVGLLRDEWGQPDGTRLSMLTAPNTVFGVFSDADPVAQPGAVFGYNLTSAVNLEVALLADLRTGPLVGFDQRGGIGLPLTRDVRSGDMGEGAVAVRLSGSTATMDWSTHIFHGLSRTPTLISTGPSAVTAIHDEITQVGFEIEGAPGDWRLWSEGFWRQGGRDAVGAATDFGHMTLGAEYQYFAALGGAADVILGAELRGDTRGDLADQPFQNGIAAGVNLVQNQLHGWELDYAFLRDFNSGGTGHRVGLTKPLSESPSVEFQLTYSAFNAGQAGTALDAFEQDRRISTSVGWKF
jgi:hypothetical protein